MDAVVMMRFPSEVKAALKQAAAAEQRSMSNLALAVLTHWLVEQGYLPSKKAQARKGR